METKQSILREIDRSICEKDYKKALDKAYKAFERYKDNCFLNKVAIIYEQTNDFKGAVSVLKQMLKTEPNNQYLLEKIAYIYFKNKKYKDALKYYSLLLETDPFVSKYNFNVASMYDFLNDYGNALKYYVYAIKADSNNISALNNYAMICYKMKQYNKAIEVLNKAIELSPFNPEAYHHMGIINREYIGDLDMSLLYLKKALRLDAKYPLNAYQVALTYKDMKNIPKTIEYLNKVLEINPNYAPAKKLLKQVQGKINN